MSGSIHLIFDKTLKVLSDVLHLENSAILCMEESVVRVVRHMVRGVVDKVGFDLEADQFFLDQIMPLREPVLFDCTLLHQTRLSTSMTQDHLYVIPCLDSNKTVIALIIIPIEKAEEFNAENYSLALVVGQRLAVELEKSLVLKEKHHLSEFNASIIESLGEVTWDYSIPKKVISWYGAVHKVFGYKKEQMGSNLDFFLSKIHPSDRVMLEDRLLMNKQVNVQFSLDFQFENPLGKFMWIRIDGVMLEDEDHRPDRVVGVIKNVDEQKHAEIARIRAMIKAKDSERKRIASEIHDSLGQTLSAARLELDTLSEMYQDKEYIKKIDSVSRLIRGAIQESRTISHDLMPPALIDYGLIQAVETMINQLNRSSSVQFTFIHNNIEERFSEEFETNLYRICQEGINNIIKHARATKATIQFVRHPDYIYVSIEDDGVGFGSKNDKQKDTVGLGLKNMVNRVAYLGGKIDFETNNGSIITIEILI